MADEESIAPPLSEVTVRLPSDPRQMPVLNVDGHDLAPVASALTVEAAAGRLPTLTVRVAKTADFAYTGPARVVLLDTGDRPPSPAEWVESLTTDELDEEYGQLPLGEQGSWGETALAILRRLAADA